MRSRGANKRPKQHNKETKSIPRVVMAAMIGSTAAFQWQGGRAYLEDGPKAARRLSAARAVLEQLLGDIWSFDFSLFTPTYERWPPTYRRWLPASFLLLETSRPFLFLSFYLYRTFASRDLAGLMWCCLWALEALTEMTRTTILLPCSLSFSARGGVGC